jgi:5-methylthioadenosine/S-adenosylhomocysteine deaminase
MIDLLITNGFVLTLDSHGTVYQRAAVAVDKGRIVALGPDSVQPARRVIDARGNVVMPGFVNAHMHETLTRGLNEDLPLAEWLERICFPIDRAYTPEILRASALMNQLEMIRAGITTFVDIYRYPAVAAEVALRSGLRGVFTPQIIEIPPGVGETLESNRAFVEEWNGRCSRIVVGYGPHAPYTCSDFLYIDVTRRARETNLRVHTHLSETTFEVQRFLREKGSTPPQWLDRLGVLGPWLWVAHGVHLSDEDIDLLAQREVAVVYNPTSNMKLASGVAPVTKMLERGVTVALGTDSNLSNNNLDMFEEMRAGATLQKLVTGDAAVLSCETMLRMATIWGARALGMEKEIGSLEVGKQADIIIVSLESPHLWPALTGDVHNVAEHLVYSANAADVQTTIVEGQILMENRHVLTLDEGEVRVAVECAVRELLERAGVVEYLRTRTTREQGK